MIPVLTIIGLAIVFGVLVLYRSKLVDRLRQEKLDAKATPNPPPHTPKGGESNTPKPPEPSSGGSGDTHGHPHSSKGGVGFWSWMIIVGIALVGLFVGSVFNSRFNSAAVAVEMAKRDPKEPHLCNLIIQTKTNGTYDYYDFIVVRDTGRIALKQKGSPGEWVINLKEKTGRWKGQYGYGPLADIEILEDGKKFHIKGKLWDMLPGGKVVEPPLEKSLWEEFEVSGLYSDPIDLVM